MTDNKDPQSTTVRRSLNRLVRCTFTQVEAEHLHYLLFHNKQEGRYSGPREQYWNRHDRILNKLSVGASNAANHQQGDRV